MEDEWERELEAEEDLDLLFVKYNPQQITTDRLIAAIAEHGFEAQVQQEAELKE